MDYYEKKFINNFSEYFLKHNKINLKYLSKNSNIDFDIIKNKKSITGQFLKEVLSNE